MHKKANKKSALILLWKKINKTDLKISLKLVHFIKYKTFFWFFLSNILLVYEQNVFVGVNTCNTI